MKPLLPLAFILVFFSCAESNLSPDTIITHGNIYTVDSKMPYAEAMAIKDGFITALGSNEEIIKLSGSETKTIDVDGQFVMPGFIEGHGHFSGLGMSLIDLNFLKSGSWEEIVSMVAEKAKETSPGEWIIGRGWHQEKWDSIPLQNIHNYPFHQSLSDVSQENPVLLVHSSGHSLFANEKAMDAAGINKETPNPAGGEIVRDNNGEAIGVFEERAMRPIRDAYALYRESLSPEDLVKKWHDAINLAEQECIKKGITSFQDAGSKFYELERYEQLANDGKLDLRLWVMVRDSSAAMKGKLAGVKRERLGNNFYTCNAVKTEVDGALGAFGAWLLEPYSDKPDFVGQNTTSIYEVKTIADMAMANGMQLCVHAIGDRANRVVLDIIEGVQKQNPEKKDLRWRIEHAQHLSVDDIPRFKELEVIASMQGIHCTSDAPFVEKRLGRERSQLGAYAWRSLLDQGVVVANGTDAPVEDVDPIPSFYASVTRKRADSGMVFFKEQAMTREEAVYSYTLGNAYAAFEEDIKGSLSVGKLADIVVLDKDLIKCAEEEILDTKILYTIIDGKIKYQSK